MENKIHFCSSVEHKETEAKLYCQECKIYMCNKCENFHSKLCQHHHTFNLMKDINEIFTGFCKEENHLDKLEYFCKDHQKLCCSACIAKINKNGKGQHGECDICLIQDIKNEKKEYFSESIKNMEKLSKDIIKEKEELKIKIQKLFTDIRNTLNEREDEILNEIEKKYDEIFIKENIIRESMKLPKKITNIIEKGNLIDKDWEDNNKLPCLINDCLNIQKDIALINSIEKNIKNYRDLKNKKIIFFPKDANGFLQQIKNFGKIISINQSFDDSIIINKNIEYINCLNNWINIKNFKYKLLYRKSENDLSYETFHRLCDNQGPTLVLFKTSEGYVFGGYTPLDWDIVTEGWKNDNETFVFSLTNKKIFIKKEKNISSIYCDKTVGPWFPYIGARDSGKKNMSQGEFRYKENDIYFNNFNEIISNDKDNKFFDLDEVEIYKIYNN